MDETLIGSLIEIIYASAFEECGWDSALQSLRAQFQAAQASVQMWDCEGKAPPLTITTIEPSSLKPYHDYYHQLDPTSTAMRTNTPGLEQRRTYTEEDFIDRAAWFRSEFYNDFIRRACDMGQPLGCILNASERTVSNFLVHRPPSGEEYSDDDRKLLRALSPHLNRGLHMYRELSKLRAKAGLFDTAFDTLAATFLLDHAGRVLALNKNAEGLLHDGSALCVAGGRLSARHPPDAARLAAALVPPQPGVAPADIVLRGPASGPGVRVGVTPVNGGTIPLFGKIAQGEQVAFMVTAAALGPSLQNLMALYGLTRAEAEVTLLLAEGLRAPQIATHRETSIGTVNTQLKHIYAKTGVDGHVGLMVKLLGR